MYPGYMDLSKVTLVTKKKKKLKMIQKKYTFY